MKEPIVQKIPDDENISVTSVVYLCVHSQFYIH